MTFAPAPTVLRSADSSHLRATEIGFAQHGCAGACRPAPSSPAALEVRHADRGPLVLRGMGDPVNYAHREARAAGAMEADLSPAGLESGRQRTGESGRRRGVN